jgi:hypothetical protein
VAWGNSSREVGVVVCFICRVWIDRVWYEHGATTRKSAHYTERHAPHCTPKTAVSTPLHLPLSTRLDEISLPLAAQSEPFFGPKIKKKKVPTYPIYHLPGIRRFQFYFSSAPLGAHVMLARAGDGSSDVVIRDCVINCRGCFAEQPLAPHQPPIPWY